MELKNSFENPKSKPEIFIKKEFFELIKNGTKTLELRVGFAVFSGISAGDEIIFSSGSNEKVEAEVVEVRNYRNLNDVLDSEDLNQIAPGLDRKQAINISQRLYRQDQIDNYGLLVIEFKLKEKNETN